jgi:plasmid stability protein
MSQLLVRDLDPKAVDTLKRRAAGNHRSLQQELKLILEETAHFSIDSESVARRIRANLAGKRAHYSDSARTQAEDRRR